MRVVLTAHPMYSHLLPLVMPVARLFREAGHDVAIATGAKMTEPVVRDGFTALALPNALSIVDVMHDPTLMNAPDRTSDAVPPAPTAEMFARGFVDIMAPRFARDLIPMLADWKPDFVLRDVTEFGGYLAAEQLGIPQGALDIAPMVPMSDPIVLDRLNGQRDAFGLDPISDPWHHVRTFRASIVPEIFYPESNRPVSGHYYRPPSQTSVDQLDRTIADLPDDRPLVLASLGTTATRVVENAESILDMIIGVLADLPVTGVVAIGQQREVNTWRGSSADNVHLTPFVQQKTLLAATDAFITHGGFNSIGESLGEGVPMVLLPLIAEEPANAERMAELGVGVPIDVEGITAAALRAGIERVLNEPGYRARSQYLQRQLLALPPLSQIVDDVTHDFGS